MVTEGYLWGLGGSKLENNSLHVEQRGDEEQVLFSHRFLSFCL